ncbi:MAG TPA: MFS transporter [Ramlibacter sp.]|uniref:MFS transporter n=1 Tax=Ramlibacter sp. TaxID=1917967 RepID=UPI002D3366F0|nr:MFS transporter [Ramlibacter sp.]HZY20488.1 MFS transporter [Ramlibacter sp.]
MKAGIEMYPTARSALRFVVAVVLVLVALSTALIALRIEQVLLELAEARALRTAQQLRAQVEAGFRFGLALPDQAALPGRVQRLVAQDAALAAVRVQAEQGETVAQAGRPQAFAGLNPSWTQQLLGQGAHARSPASSVVRHAGPISFIGVPTIDASGRRSGVLWLVHDRAALQQAAWSVLASLWPWAAGLAAVLSAVLAALAVRWMGAAHGRLAAAAGALAQADAQGPVRGPADVVRLVDGRGGSGRALAREWLLVLLAVVFTFSGLAGLAWKARELARPMLLAEVEEGAQGVLRQAVAHIERALALGIPADGLVGVEAMLQAELAPAQELAFLALQRPHGSQPALAIHEGGDVAGARAALGAAAPGYLLASQPVPGVGQLLAGTRKEDVDGRLRSILLDLLFAVVVSLVLVREVLAALWSRSGLRPYVAFESAWRGWRARAVRLGADSAPQRVRDWIAEVRGGVRRLLEDGSRTDAGEGPVRALARLRLIVFLTALSDELLRPFFAVFASEARPMVVELSPTMLAALPVAAFMLTLTLAQPLGPWITRRVDVRRALLVVAVCGAALLAATAVTANSLGLVLLRAGSGAAYGLLLILAQTTVLRITDSRNRARGLVEVSGAIVAAGVCGPALGGLLADGLGTAAAFAACAACLGMAAVLSTGLAPVPGGSSGNLAGLGGWRGLAAVLRHPRAMAVTWLAAVPARLAAAAVLLVAAPLYVQQIGETPAISGRVQLLYFLAFMLTAPWVARWSDIGRSRRPWILWGCALSVASCAALPLVGGVAGIALCCGLLGVAQALLSAPQLALVTEAFDRDPQATQAAGATPEQALAAFRFIERFGSIVAPFVVALAVSRLGLGGAVGAIGVVLALACAGLALVLFQTSPPVNDRHVQA